MRSRGDRSIVNVCIARPVELVSGRMRSSRERLSHLHSTQPSPPQHLICSTAIALVTIQYNGISLSSHTLVRVQKYSEVRSLPSLVSDIAHTLQADQCPDPCFLQSSICISLPTELILSHFLSTGKIETGSARACANDAFGVVGGTKERIQTTTWQRRPSVAISHLRTVVSDGRGEEKEGHTWQ